MAAKRGSIAPPGSPEDDPAAGRGGRKLAARRGRKGGMTISPAGPWLIRWPGGQGSAGRGRRTDGSLSRLRKVSKLSENNCDRLVCVCRFDCIRWACVLAELKRTRATCADVRLGLTCASRRVERVKSRWAGTSAEPWAAGSVAREPARLPELAHHSFAVDVASRPTSRHVASHVTRHASHV